MLKDFGGRGFGDFKPALADLAIEVSTNLWRDATFVADPGHIDAVLADGAERARAIADPILAE